MTRRGRIWFWAATLFALANLGGGIFAAVRGEPMHAGAHAVLLLVGVWLAMRLGPGRRAREFARREGAESSSSALELNGYLTRLEQSVDAVAIEVERIGEGQRSMTRRFTDRGPRD